MTNTLDIKVLLLSFAFIAALALTVSSSFTRTLQTKVDKAIIEKEAGENYTDMEVTMKYADSGS